MGFDVAAGDIEIGAEDMLQLVHGVAVGVKVGVNANVGKGGVDVEGAVGVIGTRVERPLHPANNIKMSTLFITIRCNFLFAILTSFIV